MVNVVYGCPSCYDIVNCHQACKCIPRKDYFPWDHKPFVLRPMSHFLVQSFYEVESIEINLSNNEGALRLSKMVTTDLSFASSETKFKNPITKIQNNF